MRLLSIAHRLILVIKTMLYSLDMTSYNYCNASVVSNCVSIFRSVDGVIVPQPHAILGRRCLICTSLLKITLRVSHILSVKHFNASNSTGILSGPGAFLDFCFLIADTTSSFVITQSIVSCWVSPVGCLLLPGFHLLPDHMWLYLVPYRMDSGELVNELKYSCHSWSEIVVSSAADLVVFSPVLISCRNPCEF